MSGDPLSSSGTDDTRSKKKTRGPYTGKRLSRTSIASESGSEDTCILQFDDHGVVVGPDAATRTSFSNYIGRVTRAHVPDFVTNWRQIDSGLKDTLWEDIKRKWKLPESPVIKAMVLKKAGELRKNWKHKFTVREKAKGSSLSGEYEHVSAAGLEILRQHQATAEFKKISEQNKINQSHNQYPHHLGTSGYIGKMAEWVNEDPLDKLVNFPENLRPLLLTGNERTKNFLRARTTKGPDGNYYINVDATKELAIEVTKYHEQQSQGSFVPVRQHDALSSALGKPDHPGRVRGMGKNVTIRNYYGSPSEYSKGRHSGSEMEKAQMKAELKAELTVEFEAKLMSILAAAGVQTPVPGFQTTLTPQSNSSHASVDPFADAVYVYPKVRLTVVIDGISTVVAIGRIFEDATTVHGVAIAEGNAKVSVDLIATGNDSVPLPVPTSEFCTLREAETSFVQWPKNLIIFPSEEKARSKGKNKVQEKSPLSKKRSPVLDEAAIRGLSKHCRALYESLSVRTDKDNLSFDVSIKGVYHVASDDSEDVPLCITFGDIMDVFRRVSIDTSVIQIFVRYLHENAPSTYPFLNPSRLQYMVNEKSESEVTYFISLFKEFYETSRYFIAPCYETHHWLLLVIEYHANTVYVFDSMRPKNGFIRPLKIRQKINEVLKFARYEAIQDRRVGSNPIWKSCQCPQQPFGSELCGYYVMRFMYDIISLLERSDSHSPFEFEEVLEGYDYDDEHITEVCELWAEYFKNICNI